MTHKFRFPHYFTAAIHREIGEMYVSTALADIALGLVLIFEPIFLYVVIGLTIPEILLFMASLYALNALLLPWGAKIVSRYGYEHGIFFSIPFMLLYWFLLFGSQNSFSLLIYVPFIYAIEKSLFWPAFHAIIARFARDEQRGREFSMLYAIVNVAQIIGPIIGGVIAQHYGVRVTFLVASAVYVCSIIPFFTTKEIFTPKLYKFRDTWEIYKAYPIKFIGYLGYGEELLLLTIWPIFIYLVVGNYEETGLLATLATFIGTIMVLFIGRVTDRHSKQLLLKVGTFIYSQVWLVRLAVTTFFGAFFVDALSRTSKDLVTVPLTTMTYERAEATYIMPYVVFFEQSIALGKFLAAILGIIVFVTTGSFLALFILAAAFSLLYMLA